VAILSDVKPEIANVDRGCRGVELDGVKVYHPGLRGGITQTLHAMIRRRSAIEPAIGDMKTDGRLDRNWPKESAAITRLRFYRSASTKLSTRAADGKLATNQKAMTGTSPFFSKTIRQ
jgi:hypothetical protein